MKRVFAAIVLSFILLLPAHAQEADRMEIQEPAPARNAIGISLNLGTGLQHTAAYASVIVSLLGTAITNDTFFVLPFFIPGPNLEYERWLNDKVAIGINLTSDTVSALPIIVLSNVGILPTVKYRWLDNGSLRIYSKAAVGYMKTIQGSWDDGKFTVSAIPTDFFEMLGTEPQSALMYSWVIPTVGLQIDPLCFEIPMSKPNSCFFLEMGLGTLGSFSFGIKESF
jgi:hypothetical protein